MRAGTIGAGVAAGVCALLAFSSASSAQSLEQALEVAYRTNPTIRAERARLEATEELSKQAWADALPQISAGGSYRRIDQTQVLNPAVIGGPADERSFELDTLTAGIEAEQVIFAGFRNYNAIRQARARVKSGGAQLAATEQQVLLSAATAYFDVLRDAAIFEANSNQVTVLLRQLEEANARFRVGEVTKTDVSQAEARQARARASLSSSQAQLAISRARYKELVGEAPGTLAAPEGLPALPESLDAAIALGEAYAPAILAARYNEIAARRQVAVAKGVFAPTVSLTAGYQYADEPSSFALSDEQFSYGVRASVPIFQGGRNFSRVREARALAESAGAAVIEAQRRVTAEVTSAYEQLIAAKTTIRAAEAQVEANTLALEGVRREAQLGARTTLDVLDAEQELLNAEVQLATARRDERVAAFALLAAAGVLTVDNGGEPPLAETAE